MDKKILYLDCSSGISGDMTVAALLDLGADEKKVRSLIEGMALEGVDIEIKRVKKSGLDACDFDVILDKAHENHDHDMEYLYGKDEGSHDHHHEGEDHHEADHHYGEADHHEECHYHGEADHHEECHHHREADHHEECHHHREADHHEECHHHGDEDHHDEQHHHHEHRGLKEILSIIDNADMTDHAKSLAVKIFTILAEAEAKAHGTDIEHVHFHEVGAVDSIVDVLSAAICLDDLGVDEVIIPYLAEGWGTVRCQHGLMPIPVPAVTNIALAHGLTLKNTGVKGELVTPTGVAIAAAVKTSESLPENYRILACGIGAGKRKYELPGILRAMLLETEEKKEDKVIKLETDIDDCSGEALGYCLDRLLQAGAREAHFVPVFMKKNRPAYKLELLCDEKDRTKLEQIIFRETSSIGIRRIAMERTILDRQIVHAETSFGEISAKLCRGDGFERIYPEYEDVAALCREKDLPFMETFKAIEEEIKEKAKQ